MNVARLASTMEDIAPTRMAASWDNVGLLVGDPAAPLTRILLAIDCTSSVVAEAAAEGCEAVVAYHPPLFEPSRRFVAGSPAFALARAGIAVYSPHTALDAAEGGTNDVLADLVGMTDRAALRPARTGSPEPGPDAGALPALGLGRVGPVAPAPLVEMVGRVKRALGAEHVLVAGPRERNVARVAVCAGSGGELVGDAVAARADVLLTGELRHHDALRAAGAGLSVVCTLHSVSERCALGALRDRLSARLPGVSVLVSRADVEVYSFA